jgi:hypothetical protein
MWYKDHQRDAWLFGDYLLVFLEEGDSDFPLNNRHQFPN